MDVFTNAESAERIMYGVSKNLNGNRDENPLSHFHRILDGTCLAHC